MSSEVSLLSRLSTPFVSSPCSSRVQPFISTIAVAILLPSTWSMFLNNPELGPSHKILACPCNTHFLLIYHTHPTNKQLQQASNLWAHNKYYYICTIYLCHSSFFYLFIHSFHSLFCVTTASSPHRAI